MPPRKGKNKKNEKEDQAIDQQADSKWAKLLKEADQDSEKEGGDAQELYSRKKQVFNFDFSGQKILYEQKPEKPKEPSPEQILSPQQIQRRQQIAQKQQKQKAIKNEIKRQKNQQKRKAAQVLRQKQKKAKEQEEKQQEELLQQINKNKRISNTKCIPIILVSFLLLMFLLQYQKEIYTKFEHLRLGGQQDLYAILETDSGAADKQLKAKYKNLILKYHPDKNPNCEYCKQKFDKIMKAWEVLGNQDKRKSYDLNSGYVTDIKSKSLTLKPSNYHNIVENSQELWIVQVLDSTNQYCHYFANFWEEAVQEYGHAVRFARVDIWHQSDMSGYLPYRFQVFPGIYTLRRGSSEICHFDFQRPLPSIKKCIQEISIPTKALEVQNLTQINLEPGKIGLVLGPNMKINLKFNLIVDKFPEKFSIFTTESTKRNTVTIVSRNDPSSSIQQRKSFTFNKKDKAEYKKFEQFLRSSVIQQKNFCQIIDECQEKQCLIILNRTQLSKAVISSRQPYSTIIINAKEQKDFQKEIEKVKNRTGLIESFEVGLYMGGKIDLGYWDEIMQLKPENGQLVEIQCKWKSWTDTILQALILIKNAIFSK